VNPPPDRDSLRPLLDRATTVATALVSLSAAVALIATLSLEDIPTKLELSLAGVALASAALVVVLWFRARAVRVQNEELLGRERILRAAAFAADRFVGIESLEAALPEVLERLGRATTASRVYLFENERDRQGQVLMSIRQEWCADGVRPSLNDATNQAFPYTSGYMHWYRKLMDGLPVQVVRSDASGTEREDMDAEDTLSVAAVPIYVAGELWGFLGIDDCERERAWSSGELEALTVAAATYGAAVARQRSTGELAEAEERFRVLVEQAPAVVYIDALDASASTQYISPQIEAITGYSADEWMADPQLWVRLLHEDDRADVLLAQARHNDTGEPFRMEYRLRARDGRDVWIRDEAVMIRDEDGSFRHSQGVIQDITDLKSVGARLEELEYRDQLTELPNLPMFLREGEIAIGHAERQDRAVAVLVIDIDGFKLANESLGTTGGDKLLKEIAKRIRVTLRDIDTLARRGGDDFLVLLSDLDRDEYGDFEGPTMSAEWAASRIGNALRQYFDIDGREVFLTASIGISVYPDDAEDVDTLILHAEHAVRSSKLDGPGGVGIYGATATDSKATFALVSSLRRAVERQEWVLVYQPQVQLSTGAVHGVEALLRWTSEEHAGISPAEFIPLAEDLGLIDDIGDWVVDELVEQERRWRADGMQLELGFNLSPRQFLQDQLAERLMKKFDDGHIDPGNVVVEITETSAMRDAERAEQILSDLHGHGLKLALDDFGTGYSSLSRLRTLPIDILKIDRSFVTGVDEDPELAKIVAAFIQLGKGLEMTTLAEGIETEGEFRFLREQGCDLGQGFYFSRPIGASEFLQRWFTGEITLTSGAEPPREKDLRPRQIARVWQPGRSA
jgi:diguanylate cyclase (GGDEF)-like protein/PAS domain S-box-containing protein